MEVKWKYHDLSFYCGLFLIRVHCCRSFIERGKILISVLYSLLAAAPNTMGLKLHKVSLFNFLLAKWPSFAAIFITLWIQKVFCFMLSIFLWSSQLWGAKPHLGVAPNTMGLKLRNGSNLKIQIQFDPSILKVSLWLLLYC